MKTANSFTMEMTDEISHVTVPVLHFRSFDQVTREDISFRIYRKDDWFKAVPQAAAKEYELSGLPAELVFVYTDHVVLAANNMEDEAMAVIKNIILELQMLDLL